MALPKLEATRYTCVLPLSKKTIEYRPFLVKEQKHLLVAGESEDGEVISKSLLDLMRSCTYGDINIDILPMADIEYLFLQIRIKSAGETSDIQLPCEKCEEANEYSIDLSGLELDTSNLPDPHIKLNETMGIHLCYPSMMVAEGPTSKGSETDQLFAVIRGSIESVYNEEEVFTADDWNDKELNDFIDSFNNEQFALIQEFLTNIPRVKDSIEFNCMACGAMNKKELSGIQDFFS